MSDDCVFCKIVAGALPCCPVYEDKDVIAFLDIAPIAPGHVLVMPKAHHDPITNTPDELLARCIQTAKQIVKAQKIALRTDGANVTQANGACAGQAVSHLHIHVIPRFSGGSFNWKPGEYASHEAMAAMAKKIREAINA